MAKYLDSAGLKTMLTAIKGKFASATSVEALTEAVANALSQLEVLTDMTAILQDLIVYGTGHTIAGIYFAKEKDGTTSLNQYGNIGDKRFPIFDTSKATSVFMTGMEVEAIPDMSLPEATRVAFPSNPNLLKIGDIFAPKITNADSMFAGNKVLRTLGNFYFADTGYPAITTAANMFQGCVKLTTIPPLNLYNVKNITHLFCNCPALKRIEELVLGPALTEVTDAFLSGSDTGVPPQTSLTYVLIRYIGYANAITTWDFSNWVVWGTGHEENRQSLVRTLLTHSKNRSTQSPQTINLHSGVKALLTDEEKAAITAKGYTLA